MAQAFLITLREGLEAALIVGIILAFLAKSGHRGRSGPVWQGVGLAVLASLVAGGLVFVLAGELKGNAEAVFEGLAMLLAVIVLSWMVIWMKRQAANIRANLEAQVAAALQAGSGFALAFLAFIVVVREGLETALFLFAGTTAATPLQTTIGGLLGLAVALFLGYLLYRGSRRLNLRAFFNVTGVLIIIFAAGLLGRGVHELQEAGLFPVLIEPIWDINPVLSDKAGLGAFLKGLFGYNGNPELLEIIFYFFYLAGALTYFFRTPRLEKAAEAAQKP